MGAAGSKATSPKLKLFDTVKMFNPAGSGQYAPGSSSCANPAAGDSRRARTVTVRRTNLVLLIYARENHRDSRPAGPRSSTYGTHARANATTSASNGKTQPNTIT